MATELTVRPAFPIKVTDKAILETIGLVGLIEWVLEGTTNSEIAVRLGISKGAVSAFIYNLPEEQRKIFEAARMASAEVFVDEAGELIDEATDEGLTTAQVNLRKLRAEHRYKVAAFRNPNYRSKPPEEGTGRVNTGAPITFNISVAPPRPVIDCTVVEASREPE